MDDNFWTAGVVLYWAEGAKTARRLRLAHSEPQAFRLFRGWTWQYLDSAAAFRASLTIHADNDERAARAYWAEELSLNIDGECTKTFIKPDGTGHRKNHLRYGVCNLTMLRSTNAWVRALTWVDVLRKRWLS